MSESLSQFKLALVSASNKEGLVDFLNNFAHRGLKILSTGGTARHLRENGLKVMDVSEYTGFPEVMDGRVKTLHPHIHMSILARGYKSEDLQTLEKYQLQPIDLVIGNLYPFEEASQKGLADRELSDFIDIGGPSFLRGAAKGFERVTVVCHPSDYDWIAQKDLSGDKLSIDERKELAAKIFAHVSSYDSMIARKLNNKLDLEYSLGGALQSRLRYGENPHQSASWYKTKGALSGLHQSEILQGKMLSYNNILDLEAATRVLRSFKDQAAAVSVKHNNPCGVAVGENLTEAVNKSLKADPMSVFGGIVSVNEEVTEEVAKLLNSLFLECVVAPSFSQESLKILQKKKNLRLLKWPQMLDLEEIPGMNAVEVKTVAGGFLVQNQDEPSPWNDGWTVSGEEPSSCIKADLQFAWNVCAHLKSNAIAICGQGQSLGLGMGQVNRVDAVRQAISRMKEFHPDCKEAVLASDAFFPFEDSIEEIDRAGIRWIIQPGGSIRDKEVLLKASELGVNILLTGERHFRH